MQNRFVGITRASLAHRRLLRKFALRATWPLQLAVAALLVPRPATAWEYAEHRDVSCVAVSRTCAMLEAERAQAVSNDGEVGSAVHSRSLERIELIQAFICQNGCGLKPKQTPHELLGCEYDFGDVVALVDYKNDTQILEELKCQDIPGLKQSLLNEAWEALIADEHFTPLNVRGARHASEMAQARFAYAGTLLERGRARQNQPALLEPNRLATATDMSVVETRKALFSVARAMHIVQDSYAAGHNAIALDNQIDPRLTTIVHNRYNARGLDLRDRYDTKQVWRALGDGQLGSCQNTENSKRLMDASTRLLCSLVAEFLELGHELPGCGPTTIEVDRLMPEASSDNRISRLGASEFLFDYAYTSYVHESISPVEFVRATRFHHLGITLEIPLSQAISLRVGPEYEWYATRAVRRAEFDAFDYDHRKTRFGGAHLGFGWRPRPTMLRALTWGITSDLLYGYVNAASDAKPAIRAFDGVRGQAYLEALIYTFALRFGLDTGFRRSALVAERFDWNIGPTVSFVFRPL